MSSEVQDKVKLARELFKIESYPSNLFTHLENCKKIANDSKLIIFKEKLDKLSGFIGYEKGYAYIVINYERPITHQNFTLAHELGHWIMHKNLCFSDEKVEFGMGGSQEKEASEFAQELLWPIDLFNKEFAEVKGTHLLGNLRDFAYYINDICHKYCVSFEHALRRFLYADFKVQLYKDYKKDIDKALGRKFTEFDPEFYIAKDSLFSKVLMTPYLELREMVNQAITDEIISQATGESILYSYDLLED